MGNLATRIPGNAAAACGGDALNLTIVTPCFNEGETLATCVRKAYAFFGRTGIAGEALVSDDGSTGGAIEIGARVVSAPWADLNYIKKNDVGIVVRRWVSTQSSRARLRLGWMPPHPALYVRRDWMLELGSFNEKLRIAADYDLILRLLAKDGDFRYVPGTVVSMRLGGASNRNLWSIIRKSLEDI